MGCLCLAFLCCIAVLLGCFAEAKIQDTLYYQDVSHRAVFSGQTAVAGWESLPFTHLNEFSPLYLRSQDCFVGLSDSMVYSSSRNKQASKISLENPYNRWKLMVSMEGLDEGDSATWKLLPSQDSTNSFFVVISNNILRMTVTDNTCAQISSFKSLLPSNSTFGTIAAATASSTRIWLASSTSPNTLTQVDLNSGSVDIIKIAGMTAEEVISSAYWVEPWNKLFVGTGVALYTLTFDKEGKYVKTQHEWITGLLDAEVVDMSYDSVNDALWVAEVNSIHKLTANNIWYRYGQRQGSPTAQITSVTASNGFIYVGSVVGLSRIQGDADPIQYYKSERDATPSTPWPWNYYAGQRYLADDAVGAVVSGSGNSAMAVTKNGLSFLHSDLWTLDEKSQTMETYQVRHDREGLTTSCNLRVYADLSSFGHYCDDNDGLWTSMHAMGEVYRYLNTKDEGARTAAWTAFEALERLNIYPGNYPHFPARSFVSVNDSNVGGCGGEPWVQSKVDPNYMWKATTSSDEIDGHLAVYPLLFDHIASTPEEKNRVLALIEGITGAILEDDLYLVDPSTGKPTEWGFWNPAAVNDNPEYYSERGGNSIEILAYMSSAYSVTKDEKYKKKFWELAIDYDYLYSATNGKVDSPLEDNHSDNELIFMAYHILLYSFQRLSLDDTVYNDVKDMVQALVPSMQRTWTIVQGEMSPLWLGIYAGMAGLKVSDQDVSNAVWTLRRWSIEMIEWPINNYNRWDITMSPFYARDSTNPLMRQILPQGERAIENWNSDPFEMTASGSGYGETAPYVFQLPYHLMRYNGLISGPLPAALTTV